MHSNCTKTQKTIPAAFLTMTQTSTWTSKTKQTCHSRNSMDQLIVRRPEHCNSRAVTVRTSTRPRELVLACQRLTNRNHCMAALVRCTANHRQCHAPTSTDHNQFTPRATRLSIANQLFHVPVHSFRPKVCTRCA